MKHLDSIKKTILYIENHLDEQISIKDLAQQVHLSEYYFYRLFKQFIGCSVMQYIQKRRLSESAYIWASNNKDLKLVDLSVQYGFSSHSAYTRAFHKAFQMTPTDYYDKYLIARRQLFPAYSFWGKRYIEKDALYSSQYEIVWLKEMMLVGATIETSLELGRNYTDIYKLSEKVKEKESEILSWRYTCGQYGVAFNGCFHPIMPDKVSFQYFRGYKVNGINTLPKGFRVKKIDAGKYLKIKTTTQNDIYEKTLDYLYAYVVPKEGILMNPKGVNVIERFNHMKKVGDIHSEVEIYIPYRIASNNGHIAMRGE